MNTAIAVVGMACLYPDARNPALLAPYLERRLGELLPSVCLQVGLEPGPERRQRRDQALTRLLGAVWWRLR
jgi:hypothetical protein